MPKIDKVELILASKRFGIDLKSNVSIMDSQWQFLSIEKKQTHEKLISPLALIEN